MSFLILIFSFISLFCQVSVGRVKAAGDRIVKVENELKELQKKLIELQEKVEKEKLQQLAVVLSGKRTEGSGKKEKKKATFAEKVKVHDYDKIIGIGVPLVSDKVPEKIKAVVFEPNKIEEAGTLPTYKNLVPRNQFFEDVMGVKENIFKENITDAGKFIKKEGENYIIKKHEVKNKQLKPTKQTYQSGYFEQLSVADLIEACKWEEYPGNGTLSVIEGVEKEPYNEWFADKVDSGAMQALFPQDTVFQVASNFNGLEAVSWDKNIENQLIIDYTGDSNQGPGASISAAPGLILRRYYLFYDENKDPKEWGQKKSGNQQVNFLSKLPLVVSQAGYVQLDKTPKLQSPYRNDPKHVDPERDDDYQKVKIGWHGDVQVSHGFKYGDKHDKLQNKHIINQVFTGAVDFRQGGKKKNFKHKLWAKEILKAAYEGTLRAAFIKKKKKVVLTLIGGGAFENDQEWIYDAIARMADFIEKSGLEVTVVSYTGFPKSKLRNKYLGLVKYTGGTYKQYRNDGVYSPK